MKVDRIDRYADFVDLRASWNSVYAADPDANIFLSWDWMAKWLQASNDPWFILAARTNARDYVGFFPLRLRTRLTQSGEPMSEIAMAGGNFADYTGLIVRPAAADATIDAFARTIKSLDWATARFSRMRINEHYHARLVAAFHRSKFDVLANYPMKDAAGPDNSICPFVQLPSTWDQYLAGLSTNRRQKLRRLLRNVEHGSSLRITQAGSHDIDVSIDALIALWTQKWSARKGTHVSAMQHLMRTKIRHYRDLGILYCPVLWNDSQPIGVHVNLIDSEKRVMHFFVGGRAEECSELQPGMTLHAHSIRHCIEMGLIRYDFLRGNEAYKYLFGSTDRSICSTIIHRRSAASRGFDPRSVPEALKLIKEQKSPDNLVRAEVGYRTILDVDPDCIPALLGLAEARAADGDIMAAEKLLRGLVFRQRDSQVAWLALGQCLAAQRSWPESEACYRRALELNPRLASAHYHLGVMYESKGGVAQAQRSYRAAIAIDPDFRDVKQRLIDSVLRAADTSTPVQGRSREGTS